jgi:hypothetical protein
VLNFASLHTDAGWETCVARPGLISGLPGAVGMAKNVAITAIGMVGHTVSVRVCAISMIEQCADGFAKAVLSNEDMVTHGK